MPLDSGDPCVQDDGDAAGGVIARVRGPRRAAYWSLALCACAAVAVGYPQVLAACAVVYLVPAPMLWHAWSVHLYARHRPELALTCAEAACSAGVVAALLPWPLALAAIGGLLLVRLAAQGQAGIGACIAALCGGGLGGAAVGAGVAGLVGEAARGDHEWFAQGVLLAAAGLWQFGLALAIAAVGYRARAALGAARDRERTQRHALARLATRLGRYLAPGVRRALLAEVGLHEVAAGTGPPAAGGEEGVAGRGVAVPRAASARGRRPQRRWLSVCFIDIVGFTALTEQLEPEEVGVLLETYQCEMSRVALAHGGNVDKFIGDGMLVLFGDLQPRDQRADALACVHMAAGMFDTLAGLNARFHALGLPAELQLRVGIASGVCTVGEFGSAERLHYTALGRVVNLASRLENQAQAGQILVSERTARLVGDSVSCTPAGRVQLPGLPWPVPTWQVVRPAASSPAPAGGTHPVAI